MRRQKFLLITLGILMITLFSMIGVRAFTTCSFTVGTQAGANGLIISQMINHKMNGMNFTVTPTYTGFEATGANISVININFTSYQTASGINTTGIAFVANSSMWANNYSQYNYTIDLSGMSDQLYSMTIEASNGTGTQPGGRCSSTYTQVAINNTQLAVSINSTSPASGTLFTIESTDGHGSYNVSSTYETIKKATISFGGNTFNMNISSTNGTTASFVPTSIQVPDSSYTWTVTAYDLDGAYSTQTVGRTVTYRYARDGFPPELLQQQVNTVTQTQQPFSTSTIIIALSALLLGIYYYNRKG